jgi:GNAT superfamily N-acetyltransferase
VSPAIAVRPIRPGDVSAVVAMVHELADFEHGADQCHLTDEQLRGVLFAAHPAVFGHVAVDSGGEPVGMALWFVNFSTWEGTHGLYLEDLYVRPAARGTGAGVALLAALAQICVDRGYRRMEWVMLDWNPAGAFYTAMGATVTEDWVPYRLTGDALHRLADRASPASAGTH